MILVLTLLAGGFLILSPITAMTITTALAQEGEGNNTSTTGGTTTTSDDITNTTATNTTTTTRPSSSAIHLSAQPIWQESTGNTGVTPFDQTHSIVTFFGNGTLTVPDTGETIDVANNGSAISSSVTGTSFGRESFIAENGDSTAITFYEIDKDDPETQQTRGITTAVFDSNGTGTLAPFNGMIVIGLREVPPNEEGVTMTLWKWEDEIGN